MRLSEFQRRGERDPFPQSVRERHIQTEGIEIEIEIKQNQRIRQNHFETVSSLSSALSQTHVTEKLML